MLLKHIYLYLKLDEYPRELATEFGFLTRSVCNFIEKRLKLLKFQGGGFSKICFEGQSSPEKRCHIVPENALLVPVHFDLEKFQALSRDEYHEFFIEMLIDGFERCSSFHEIPVEEMLSAISDYRSGDYVNEWVYKTKLFRPAGLRASLLCSLDLDRFELTLQLDRRGGILFSEVILTTKPDEIIFEYQFKDLVLDGTQLTVNNKFGKALCSFDISTLI